MEKKREHTREEWYEQLDEVWGEKLEENQQVT